MGSRNSLSQSLGALLLASAMLLLAACGGTDEQTNTDVNAEVKEEPKEEKQVVEKPKKEEKPKDVKIDVKQELQFDMFDTEVEKAKVYEKGGKQLVDITVSWRVKKTPDPSYDKMSLFVATLFDVKQGETSLVEVNDAWNPENEDRSDVFFQNVLGGLSSAKLTYELVDRKTPLDILYTPTTETEGTETITVNIN